MKPTTAVVVLVLLVAGCARAQMVDRSPALSKAQWRQDLSFLARELPKRHKNLFHHASREQFERAVAKLDAAIPSLADHQIVVRMMQIAAMIGDGHTSVHVPADFKRYPLLLYWFGKDLRVIGAAKPYQEALGASVVRIGNTPIDDVQAKIRSVMAQDENEWFVLANSPAYIRCAEVLLTLGVVADVGHAVFTLEDGQGRQLELDVVPVALDANFNGSLLGTAADEPLYRQRPDEPFWWSYLPDSRTVYVSFRGYDSLGDNAGKLFQFVDAHPTDRLVIDMRQNSGGDFEQGRDVLLPAIKQRPAINRKGHLFVVIGRRTFSAAMVNAIDFRQQTKAILVGEPAGEKPNSYQENEWVQLPSSHLVLSYSTRYYKFLDKDAPAVEPDQRIDLTWADFKAGRDPVLDWILSHGK